VEILANESLKLRFPDPTIDPRTPDIIAIGNLGTIYSTSTGKVAEHGGFSDQRRAPKVTVTRDVDSL
jgi:hypothetical protein